MILQPENYFFNSYLLPPLFVGLLLGTLGIGVFVREKYSRVGFTFFLLANCVMLWLLADAMLLACANKTSALWWAKIEKTFVTFIPTFALIFTLTIVKRLSRLRFLVWISTVLSSVFCFIVLFGSAFVVGVYEYPWGHSARYGTAAPWFMVFFFSVMVTSFIELVRRHQRTTSLVEKKRLKAFLVAFGFGYLASVDYLPSYGVAVYPAGFLPIFVFIAVAAMAIRRYRLVDITPAFAAEQIIDTMGEALIVFDESGLVQLMNRTAHRLFGDDGEAAFRLFKQDIADLKGGVRVEEREVEVSIHRRAKVLSYSAAVMNDDVGRPIAFVFVMRDITERKLATRALIEKTAELAKSKAELEQLELFAFVASHDLQEPLRKIISFGDRLKTQSEGALTPGGLDSLGRMQSAALRMSQYIEDIVQFSRVTTKTQPFEEVDMNEACHEAITDLELRIQETGAKIKVEPLPKVRADRLQMRQLFQNMLANAIKFHREGQNPRVTVKGRVEDGSAVFSIEDNGIGFDEKYVDRIFKPFERLHGRNEYEGSGMGLAICQRIVLRHNGKISVKSAPGEGSTFFIQIPVHTA